MSTELTGILLCHGHNFTQELPPILPSNVKWIHVNLDSEAEPDIIVDVTDIDDLVEKLGTNRYDYVVDFHCPSINAINLAIQNAGILLKRGGKFIFLAGVSHLLLVLTRILDLKISDLFDRYIHRDQTVLNYLASILNIMIELSGYTNWIIPNDSENKPGRHIIFTK